jgi:hypothetical protein
MDVELENDLDICDRLNKVHDRLEPFIQAARDAAEGDRAERLHIGELTWEFRYYLLEQLEKELQRVPFSMRPGIVDQFVGQYANAEALDYYISVNEIAALERAASSPDKAG